LVPTQDGEVRRAPLLGRLQCAAGAVMFAQIANPVWDWTGAPISMIFGGNLFSTASGCLQRRHAFNQGIQFFMIALADQEEVKRVVREIKGCCLPAVTN